MGERRNQPGKAPIPVGPDGKPLRGVDRILARAIAKCLLPGVDLARVHDAARGEILAFTAHDKTARQQALARLAELFNPSEGSAS